jgi:nucleoside-diphosphate-sugar epimerase
MFQKTNVFISGSSGFVGQNLVKYLGNHGVKYESLDLRRPVLADTLNGATSVIHMAGKAHDLKQVSDSDEYYAVNYELTKKLYDVFLKSDATLFIFVSSVKAVADKVETVLTENVDPLPQTDYGKSKLMAEKYIQNQALPEGKSYYIMRPCMIHGPGNKGNLNLLYKFVKKGIPYPFAAFQNQRSFLSVENFCFILKEFITRQDIPSGVYNVTDDEPLSTNDLIRLLASGQNKKARLWKIPKQIIILIARLGDRIGLPLNTERLDKLTENYKVSNNKVKKAINKSLPLTTIEGLTLTSKSFQNQG